MAGKVSYSDNIQTTDEDDSILFRSVADFRATTSLNGGAGSDTLRFVGADGSLASAIGGTIALTDFSGFSNLENIVLGNGPWVIDLGARAKSAFSGGVVHIYATESTDSVDISVKTGGPTLYATGSGSDDRIYGGDGNDVIEGGTGGLDGDGGHDMLRGYAGNDTIVFHAGSYTAADKVDGGADTDTLRLLDGQVLADKAFQNTVNMEVISLGDGSYNLTLDAFAKAAFTGGLVKVAAGAGTDALTLNVGANGPAVTVTGSAGADAITGGAGADTINGGGGDDILKGGAGNDTIVFNNGALTAGDTVDGGAGYDAIRLLGGGTLADAAFTQVSNIESISIGAGSYNLTLGEEAKAAFTDGNVRVVASGATSVSLDAGSLGIDGYRFSFTGSGGADTVVIGGNVATITGGAGADSFVLTPEAFYAATITDFQDGIDHLVIDDALIPASLDTPAERTALIQSIATDMDGGVLLNGHEIGENGTLFLAGITTAQLSVDDFLFT